MESNTINDNNHKNVGHETKSNACYIQTMKKPLSLICSINSTFIKTKWGVCLQFMVLV